MANQPVQYDPTPPDPTIIDVYRWFGGTPYRNFFRLGQIIQVPDNTAKKVQGIGVPVDRIFESRTTLGQWVYTKARSMIVIALFRDHCIVIPIYTHNGQGLEGRHEEVKEDYVPIRDFGDPVKSTENGHQPLVALRSAGRIGRQPFDSNRRGHFSSKSYAQFTQPKSHIYGTECRLMGTIEPAEDLQRLYDLVCRWNPSLERVIATPVTEAGTQEETQVGTEDVAQTDPPVDPLAEPIPDTTAVPAFGGFQAPTLAEGPAANAWRAFELQALPHPKFQTQLRTPLHLHLEFQLLQLLNVRCQGRMDGELLLSTNHDSKFGNILSQARPLCYTQAKSAKQSVG